MLKAEQIDVTHNTQNVREFVRALGRIKRPIEITFEGRVVGRMVPPGELSDQEKEQILREGWELVQKARARNKGVPDREIAKVVDAAVKRVRARK